MSKYFIGLFLYFVFGVPLGMATITSGVSESFEAALDTAGDAIWSANIGGLNEWNFGSAQTPIDVNDSSTPGITKTYVFDAAKGSGTSNFQAAYSTGQDATFEIWFKPDDSDVRQALFETGGTGDGFAIAIFEGWITVSGRDDSDWVEVYVQPLDLTDRHHQLVAVIDLDGSGGGTLSVYLDGQLIETSTNDGFGDWAGTNGDGLGRYNGNAAHGSFDDFIGEISIFRFYDSRALTASEVQANYEAVATADPVSILDKGNLEGINFTIWDADDPGDDPANTWEMSSYLSQLSLLEGWSLLGGVKPSLTTIASSNYIFDQAYYFDGTGYGTSEENLTSTANNMLFEMWIKPDDLTGQELLMEFGGSGDGTSFALNNSDFLFHANNTSSNVLTMSYDLTALGLEEFIQVGAFIDIDNNSAYLYINGEQVDSTSIAEFIDFEGGNTNGLGRPEDTYGLSGYGNYEGLISYIKISTKDFTQTSLSLSEADNLILNSFIAQHKGKGIIFSVE